MWHGRCQNCGKRLEWETRDLEYARERLARGQHASCACDDDCAFEVSPWSRSKLTRALYRSRKDDASRLRSAASSDERTTCTNTP